MIIVIVIVITIVLIFLIVQRHQSVFQVNQMPLMFNKLSIAGSLIIYAYFIIFIVQY